MNKPPEPLPAELTISRYQGGTGKGVTIKIVDGRSTCQIVELDLAPADLAEAIMGRAGITAEARWYGAEHIGKYIHYKVEKVWVPDHAYEDREIPRKAVAKYETHGWMGSDRDAVNPYRNIHDSRGGIFRVGYHRFRDEPQLEAEKGA